jgi:hypothetical protein
VRERCMSKNIIDLTGKRFGRLIAINFHEKRNNRAYWLCKCNCGNEKVINSGHLRSGNTKSCGCLQKETVSNIRFKHGLSHTNFYGIWANLRRRCNEKTHNRYDRYGGRGISYDEEWNQFESFYKSMYWKYIFAKKKYRKELNKTNLQGIMV